MLKSLFQYILNSILRRYIAEKFNLKTFVNKTLKIYSIAESYI